VNHRFVGVEQRLDERRELVGKTSDIFGVAIQIPRARRRAVVVDGPEVVFVRIEKSNLAPAEDARKVCTFEQTQTRYVSRMKQARRGGNNETNSADN